MIITQLTSDDVSRSSTLESDDIGKWCVVDNGCCVGFFDTRERAEAFLKGGFRALGPRAAA